MKIDVSGDVSCLRDFFEYGVAREDRAVWKKQIVPIAAFSEGGDGGCAVWCTIHALAYCVQIGPMMKDEGYYQNCFELVTVL